MQTNNIIRKLIGGISMVMGALIGMAITLFNMDSPPTQLLMDNLLVYLICIALVLIGYRLVGD